MTRFARLPLIALFALPLAAAAAADRPVPGARALAGIEPGLWEISRSASGSKAWPVCLRDVRLLAGIIHAGEPCRGSVLRDEPGLMEADVRCATGDFSRSTLTVTTPRSIKLVTGGIHRGGPFDLTLYARRIGQCRPVSTQR